MVAVASPRSTRTGPSATPRRPAGEPSDDGQVESARQARRRPDRLGRYPTDYGVPQLKDRRAWWVARVFGVAFIVSLIMNVSLVWAIVGLTPLKHVEPLFLTFANKSDQIVNIEPLQRGAKAADLVADALSREYVVYRATIVRDDREQQRRWSRDGYIGRRTAPDEFNRFIGVVRTAFEDMRQQNITREVIIVASNKIADGYYTVDYDTIDRDATEREVSRLPWTASLTVDWLPQSVRDEDKYVNPLGYTVMNYSLAQRSVSSR